MSIDRVDETTFMLYAAKHYDNPQCFDTVEFYEDLNRIKYIKRLFNRYQETGDLKERLIINHIVVLYNVFGVEATTKMLFLKLKDYYSYLKPFLEFMGYMPQSVTGIGINNKTVLSSEIVSDEKIVQLLKKI